jgi:hypothetical protein
MFALLYAFVPAALFLALRTYFTARPPDSSEAGVKGLQRGLKIGVASAAVLPLAYALPNYFRLDRLPGVQLVFLVFALAGNLFNALGIRECVRELSGESLVSALLLVPVQLVWMWYLFSVLMMSN